MAKNNYDILAFKILTYLYRKRSTGYLDSTYLYPLTDDFPVNEAYFISILEELQENKYIKGVKVTRAWGGDIVCYNTDNATITGDGINYLKDNSKMRKCINLVKEARTIMSLWI